MTLSPAHHALIEALAEVAVGDYLREVASNDGHASEGCTEHVLPRLDEAA